MLLYVVVISYYWTCSFNKKLLVSFPLVVALLAIIPLVFPDFLCCFISICSAFLMIGRWLAHFRIRT